MTVSFKQWISQALKTKTKSHCQCGIRWRYTICKRSKRKIMPVKYKPSNNKTFLEPFTISKWSRKDKTSLGKGVRELKIGSLSMRKYKKTKMKPSCNSRARGCTRWIWLDKMWDKVCSWETRALSPFQWREAWIVLTSQTVSKWISKW